MAETVGSGAAVIDRRGVRNADRLVSDREKRLVQTARVVQVEQPKSSFVDNRRTNRVDVANGECPGAVVPQQSNRRCKAAGIREWVATREIREKESAAELIGFAYLLIDLRCELILLEC